VLSDRRVWWGTAVVFLGLGAALLAGAGNASADSTDSGRHADNASSAPASSSSGSTPSKAAAAKHRPAPAAVASGARTTRAQAAAPAATAVDPPSVTTTEASRPTRVTQHVAALRSLAAPVAHAPPTPRRREFSCRQLRWPPPSRSPSNQSLTYRRPSADSADDLL